MPDSPAPLRLTLDGDALVANWRWMRAQSGGSACGAAVKANGYGLGARQVVDRLAAAGCRDFFCATWAEAEALGPLPEGAALSVLHGVRMEDMAIALASPTRPVLNSAAQVARWREAEGGACDVMVDTGINRLGLTIEEVRSGLLDGLRIETLMSHLACADEVDHVLNQRQLAAFAGLRGAIPAQRYSLANSAGILLGHGFGFDLTRPGIALYGGVPIPDDAARRALRPVVSVEAQVLQLRDVPTGATVGYGASWTAQHATRIIILNIGYADGMLRLLAPYLHAIVAGERRPLAGRISMDLIAIDAGRADIAEGDWIALDYDLPALAHRSGLSQYELLTGLGDRFERIWR
jgi:alanine racemase